ncbi:acyltransferase family protein [Olsenella massiliensis]|uniref:acyltransferase family protein n=1 Tax=Olsenella massiliensis TaxID=1622075 RepID=UPI00071E50EA|nr:acyltransferase [Olsenella massiliensis]
MNPRVRNLHVELLRIVAMLFVFACHMTIHLDWNLLSVPGAGFAVANTVVQFGQVGVCVFFMISGYYLMGRGLSVSRVLGAWVMMLAYSLVVLGSVLLYRSFVGGGLSALDPLLEGQGLLVTTLKELAPFSMGSYWFMTTYLILLLLAPFLNHIVCACDRRCVGTLIVGLLVASALSLLGTNTGVLSPLGKGITCYLIGAFLRAHPDAWRGVRPSLRALAGCLALTLMLAFNYLCLSGSPLATLFGWDQYWIYHDGVAPAFILIAALLLVVALDKDERAGSLSRLPGAPRAVLAAAARSTFGVYLLHENYLGWVVLWGVVNRRVPAPSGVAHTVLRFVPLCLGLFCALLLLAWLLDTLLVGPLVRRARSWGDRVWPERPCRSA